MVSDINILPAYTGKDQTSYVQLMKMVRLLDCVYTIQTQMARQDWTYIQISKQMAEALDKFLRTDIAKKYSMSDKNQLVRYLIIRFLEKYQKEYGLLIPHKNKEDLKNL